MPTRWSGGSFSGGFMVGGFTANRRSGGPLSGGSWQEGALPTRGWVDHSHPARIRSGMSSLHPHEKERGGVRACCARIGAFHALRYLLVRSLLVARDGTLAGQRCHIGRDIAARCARCRGRCDRPRGETAQRSSARAQLALSLGVRLGRNVASLRRTTSRRTGHPRPLRGRAPLTRCGWSLP